jgi:hypothetical protein
MLITSYTTEIASLVISIKKCIQCFGGILTKTPLFRYNTKFLGLYFIAEMLIASHIQPTLHQLTCAIPIRSDIIASQSRARPLASVALDRPGIKPGRWIKTLEGGVDKHGRRRVSVAISKSSRVELKCSGR